MPTLTRPTRKSSHAETREQKLARLTQLSREARAEGTTRIGDFTAFMRWLDKNLR